MILKSLFAAGAFAFSLLLATGASEAKTRVHLGIGLGLDSPGYGGNYGYYNGGPGYYCRDTLIFDNCYRRWPGIAGHYSSRRVHDYPYYYDGYRRPQRVYRNKISCNDAQRMVRSAGYVNIRPRDCVGTRYSFRATDHGRRYVVSVDAITGRMLRSRY